MRLATIEPSRRRRLLLAEGRALVGYVLGSRAPSALVRRYVRAVQAEEDLQPIGLSRVVRAWPALLRVIEPLGQPSLRLSRRLAIATRIVEMTPQGAQRFHDYRGRAAWVAWPLLACLLAFEAALMPLRWLAWKFAGRR